MTYPKSCTQLHTEINVCHCQTKSCQCYDLTPSVIIAKASAKLQEEVEKELQEDKKDDGT